MYPVNSTYNLYELFFLNSCEEYKTNLVQKSVQDYRFGFNGQEKDNEIKGTGNSLSFLYRIYDSRLGKFLSVDPLTKTYPWYTPYQFAGNRPIDCIDVEGAEPQKAGTQYGQYEVAPVQGTDENYGWTWSKSEDGNGFWNQGCTTSFYNGITSGDQARANDPQGDLKSGDNPPYPNVNIGRKNLTESTNELFAKFRLSLIAGAGDLGAEMADHFAVDMGVNRVAPSDMRIAAEILKDKGFIKFANKFEASALEYYRANGSLDGFVGEDYLKPRVQFSSNSGASLTLQTLYGGTQGVSATITKVTATQIQVTYRICDVFGAGKSDASRWKFPGLQSMYILQHYRNLTSENKNYFKPFFWSTEIKH